MRFEDFKKKLKNAPLFGGDVAKLFSQNPRTLRNQLSRWKKKGLIVVLRRGLYALRREGGKPAASKQLIAASLYQPSYISMESALSHYHLIPEKIVPTTSVTTRKTKNFQNEVGGFSFRHLKKSAYFGFTAAHDEYGFPYFLAEPEKALLDYLYLNLSEIKADDTDYLAFSLRLQNSVSLNKTKLKRYARRYGTEKLAKIAGTIK